MNKNSEIIKFKITKYQLNFLNKKHTKIYSFHSQSTISIAKFYCMRDVWRFLYLFHPGLTNNFKIPKIPQISRSMHFQNYFAV